MIESRFMSIFSAMSLSIAVSSVIDWGERTRFARAESTAILNLCDRSLKQSAINSPKSLELRARLRVPQASSLMPFICSNSSISRLKVVNPLASDQLTIEHAIGLVAIHKNCTRPRAAQILYYHASSIKVGGQIQFEVRAENPPMDAGVLASSKQY